MNSIVPEIDNYFQISVRNWYFRAIFNCFFVDWHTLVLKIHRNSVRIRWNSVILGACGRNDATPLDTIIHRSPLLMQRQRNFVCCHSSSKEWEEAWLVMNWQNMNINHIACCGARNVGARPECISVFPQRSLNDFYGFSMHEIIVHCTYIHSIWSRGSRWRRNSLFARRRTVSSFCAKSICHSFQKKPKDIWRIEWNVDTKLHVPFVSDTDSCTRINSTTDSYRGERELLINKVMFTTSNLINKSDGQFSPTVICCDAVERQMFSLTHA